MASNIQTALLCETNPFNMHTLVCGSGHKTMRHKNTVTVNM